MGGDHGGGHSHDHGAPTYQTAFVVGVTFNLAFVLIEFVFGHLAHSLALVADAGHNLADVVGLVLAWVASRVARSRPTERRTYGLRRFSILAALGNAVLLLVVTGGISWEAVRRFTNPAPPAGKTVMIVAAIGVVINATTALMFMSGRKKDLNIRGAFLHLAGDALVAFGVVLVGLGVLLTGWHWLDPLASLLIGIVIVVGTWSLLRSSINLALDAVPQGIDLTAVRAYLSGLPSVTDIHDLHVWGMSTTAAALTVHLVVSEPTDDAFLGRTCAELHQRFGIEHASLQIERGDTAHPCRLAAANAV